VLHITNEVHTNPLIASKKKRIHRRFDSGESWITQFTIWILTCHYTSSQKFHIAVLFQWPTIILWYNNIFLFVNFSPQVGHVCNLVSLILSVWTMQGFGQCLFLRSLLMIPESERERFSETIFFLFWGDLRSRGSSWGSLFLRNLPSKVCLLVFFLSDLFWGDPRLRGFFWHFLRNLEDFFSEILGFFFRFIVWALQLKQLIRWSNHICGLKLDSLLEIPCWACMKYECFPIISVFM